MPSNSLNNDQTAGSSPDELRSSERLNAESLPHELDERLNIRQALAEDWDTELLFLSEEEFDEAIIGVSERIGNEPVVAYDTTKIVEILVLNHSMSVDEAYEYFEFNILGAYVGERTPTFITFTFKQ
jgi:hypothetical protein